MQVVAKSNHPALFGKQVQEQSDIMKWNFTRHLTRSRPIALTVCADRHLQFCLIMIIMLDTNVRFFVKLRLYLAFSICRFEDANHRLAASWPCRAASFGSSFFSGLALSAIWAVSMSDSSNECNGPSVSTSDLPPQRMDIQSCQACSTLSLYGVEWWVRHSSRFDARNETLLEKWIPIEIDVSLSSQCNYAEVFFAFQRSNVKHRAWSMKVSIRVSWFKTKSGSWLSKKWDILKKGWNSAVLNERLKRLVWVWVCEGKGIPSCAGPAADLRTLYP